jgi:ribosome-associated heat shock protein Hsp15
MVADEEDKAWQRLDKFLFFARFCRTRAVAGELVAKGSVRINRQPTLKPHAKLRPGDFLTVALPQGVVVAEVLALAVRRGPAAEARRLYQEIA